MTPHPAQEDLNSSVKLTTSLCWEVVTFWCAAQCWQRSCLARDRSGPYIVCPCTDSRTQISFSASRTRSCPGAPWLTGICIATGLYFGLVQSPPDYQQGETVRIMYVHVPAAIMAMFVYANMAIASATALIWKHPLGVPRRQGQRAHRGVLYPYRACNRVIMGPTHVGLMVGVGRAADLVPDSVLHIYRIYRAY